MSDEARKPKVVVVMPAYNAGRTLRMTYEELPKDTVSMVILVDDGSTDATLEIARQLGLEIFVHNRNYGYGANQKTCYAEALRAGARSEEHTSELQSQSNLVCRLLLEKKKEDTRAPPQHHSSPS